MTFQKTTIAICAVGLAIIIVWILFDAVHFSRLGSDQTSNPVDDNPAAPAVPNAPRLIGGDKDAHGCLVGGGYSWCEQKQKCLRVWEEKCVSCPDYAPVNCEGGKIIPPVMDANGCYGPPMCQKLRGAGGGQICTQDAKQCPDGSYVSRTEPGCQFAPCPGGSAQTCGGIAGITCPQGFNCKMEGDYPDASGTCVSTF